MAVIISIQQMQLCRPLRNLDFEFDNNGTRITNDILEKRFQNLEL